MSEIDKKIEEAKKTEEVKKEVPPAPQEQTRPALAKPSDILKAKEYLKNLKQTMEDKWGGKKDHNPFLWCARKITPLQTRLGISPVYQHTIDEAFQLVEEPPVIDQNPEIPQRLVPSEKISPRTT